MPPLTDHQLDGLFRAALDERVEILLPLTGGEQAMVERLAGTVAHQRARRQMALLLLAAAVLLSVAIGAAAVGSGLLKLPVFAFTGPSQNPAPSSATPTASASLSLVATIPTDQLSSPGQLLVCDNLSQPSVAYLDSQGNPAGADIDILAGIAQRLGLRLQVVNALFTSADGQHTAATDGTCDIIVWDDSEPLPVGAYAWAHMIRFLILPGGSDFEAMNIPVEKPELTDAVDAALLSLADDGAYAQILQRWNLQKDQLCPEDMKPNAGFPVGACLLPATPSPAPPATPALSASGWHQVQPDPVGSLVGPYAVTWSGARFVVAGGVPGPGFYANPKVQFWTSPNGQSWSLSPVAATGYPQAFAFDGNAGVAVGSIGNQAALWTSSDSLTWTPLPNPPALTPSGQEAGMQLNHVVHGPTGYVALGELDIRTSQGDTGRALVVWSPDGRHWQRVPMAPFGDTEFTNLVAVVVVDGRYVIAGDQGGSPNAPGPTLWTSTDGQAWTAEPVLANGPEGYMDLVAGAHGALLAGLGSGSQRGSQQCTLWHSSDGLAWVPVGSCPDGLGRPGLFATPFGFAAITPIPAVALSGGASPGQTPAPFPCAGGLQVSVAGAQWTCVPPPSGPLPQDNIVAASPNRILVVEGGIWVADIAANS